jgi:hypothetical protein
VTLETSTEQALLKIGSHIKRKAEWKYILEMDPPMRNLQMVLSCLDSMQHNTKKAKSVDTATLLHEISLNDSRALLKCVAKEIRLSYTEAEDTTIFETSLKNKSQEFLVTKCSEQNREIQRLKKQLERREEKDERATAVIDESKQLAKDCELGKALLINEEVLNDIESIDSAISTTLTIQYQLR